MKGELLTKMLILATYGHANQFDKGGQPYILHPLAVMQLLDTDDEELQCIALGHDLIEDCGITFGELIEQGFTPRITDALFALTKFPSDSYEDYKLKVKGNHDATRVKMCDLRHNMNWGRPYVIKPEQRARYQAFLKELMELPR